MYPTRAKRLVWLVAMLTLSTASFALKEDKMQVMQLHANTADLNQETHRGVYLGHIALDQGTTHIRAAEAMTEGNQHHHLTQATIKGDTHSQAHYWAIPAPGKSPMHAYADIIHYYPEQHLIELIGNARVTQGGDSFSAPKIRYDTLHQHVLSEYQGQMRTTIVIHPEQHTHE